jgi:tetraacyldisaccharide 4'-kinase
VSVDRTLQRVWYQRSPGWLFLILFPLSALFAMLAALRRAAYRIGLLRSHRLACPVIVVGNITVGGTGKTPLTIWIAQFLHARGWRVGIVTRGYGGTAREWPIDVTRQSATREVGDEAVLLSMRTDALIIAGPDRVTAAERAIERGATIILCDDGLQHYRLRRDLEIVVIDAERELGNGWLLPAGPLREPASRLSRVDLIVKTIRGGHTKAAAREHEVFVRHELGHVINLRTGEQRALKSFAGTHVHAVAAIGHPDAFFNMLRSCGVLVDAHAHPDHAVLSAADLSFEDGAPVLMTEKDAVKCAGHASTQHWAVRLDMAIDPSDQHKLERLLTNLPRPERR